MNNLRVQNEVRRAYSFVEIIPFFIGILAGLIVGIAYFVKTGNIGLSIVVWLVGTLAGVALGFALLIIFAITVLGIYSLIKLFKRFSSQRLKPTDQQDPDTVL